MRSARLGCHEGAHLPASAARTKSGMYRCDARINAIVISAVDGLVHRGGVGEHHVLRQELGDAVVAERETLHEPDVETVEIRETFPRLQVRRDHDVDVRAR